MMGAVFTLKAAAVMSLFLFLLIGGNHVTRTSPPLLYIVTKNCVQFVPLAVNAAAESGSAFHKSTLINGKILVIDL